MKKTITLFALLLGVIAFAKTEPTPNSDAKVGTVKGKVIDQTIKQAIPYASIVIKSATDNSTVTGGITNDDGKFEIKKVPYGTYTFEIQYIGYKTYSKKITISKANKTIDVGTIAIQEDAEQLDGVEVVAERTTIEQKVDRKVINVGKDLVTSGATASDIMVNLPSVNVDQQTGDISMRGNQNVRVMVDGKLSNVPTAQLLKQIPSSAIKSIELITNPSAKYNPEGMSGIINIILHKNTMVGFNGSINMGFRHESKPKFNSGINLNYRNGIFNLYGNYSNNIGKNDNAGEVFTNDATTNISNDQHFKFLNNNKNHLFKVGVDLYLNEKNTLSVFTNQNLSDSKFFGNTRVFFNNDASLNQVQDFTTIGDNLSSQYNMNYKLDFAKEGHNIEIEADYNTFGEENQDRFFYSGYSPRANSIDDIEKDRTSFTGNIDYVNPLGEKAKLELGAEIRLFESDEKYQSTGTSLTANEGYIPTPNTDFLYERNIYSAYATFSKKYEKWTYQIGVRAENVEVDATAVETRTDNNVATTTPFENDYIEFYPSAFFTYTPSEKNSYQLSYSRRIDRPGLGQVNPIREWSTPLISSIGNINLQPQFTNSLEANYTRQFEGGSITGGVFYRLINDEINRALFVDKTDFNKNILTHDNFDDTTAYGVEVSGRARPTKFWNFNASFDLFSQTQSGRAETLTKPVDVATVDDIVLETGEANVVSYNFRMFNNFKINKKLSLSAFAFYRGPNEGLQFNPKAMYFVNLGARLNFAKGKGTFSVNYNDVFNTMKFAFEATRPSVREGEFRWESNTISANVSYRFGGGKYRAKSRKNRDKNEKQGGGGFL